jgi:hypothetical protein
MAKGKRRLTESRSVAGFQPFIVERRIEDNLPHYLKGTVVWRDSLDSREEGYHIFDVLSQQYIAVEYIDPNDQWYFIARDSRSRNWVATEVIPRTYGLAE